MKRLAIFAYGLVCYAVFFATFLYAIGFIGNLWVPKSMDSPRDVALGTALLVNLGLLGLFAVQHSVMARPAFKRWWTRFVPESAERSTYVLFSSLALIVLFWFWQPMGGVVWDISRSAASTRCTRSTPLAGRCCCTSPSSSITSTCSVCARCGCSSSANRSRRSTSRRRGCIARSAIRLYVGWLMIFWATPTMTVAHLVFAIMTTAYILVAIQLEERDLIAAHPEYAEYKKRVPMLLPFGKRSGPRVNPAASRSV